MYILLLAPILRIVNAEYFGVPLGKLENADLRLDVDVFIANSTMLQLPGFKIETGEERNGLSLVTRGVFFYFEDDEGKKVPAPRAGTICQSPGGDYFSTWSSTFAGNLQGVAYNVNRIWRPVWA
ncbi:unnamed protein product, partial [Mesorhabditis spiculigera]